MLRRKRTYLTVLPTVTIFIGAALLLEIVPVAVTLLEEDPESDWGNERPPLWSSSSLIAEQRSDTEPIVCTKPGRQVHPSADPEKRKYIRCVYSPKNRRWYVLVFRCPPGTHFDGETALCTFGEVVTSPCEDIKARRRESMGKGFNEDESIICP